MESPTTAGTISPSVSEEAFSHMVSHIRELFTQPSVAVGAAIVKGVSFELLFVGVILVVVLVVVLVLVLCHKCKHKGTYHTNEAECGDSDSVDTYGVASQSELEILKEEE
ncbi:contactin-associated protein-like 2 isoform X4 [Oncorhynchus nerka]|uniref:contactin-associated protein-like 2 isoform X4 n=1 Tax=Oncorhynchus nerka TaxID=8023 RepID=UPI0031B83151